MSYGLLNHAICDDLEYLEGHLSCCKAYQWNLSNIYCVRFCVIQHVVQSLGNS